MADLSSKSKRQRLKKRREPHWMRVHKGCYLGFRRGPDSWVARITQRHGGKYRYEYQALDASDYDNAMNAAEIWFSRMGSSAARIVLRGSVRAALQTYVDFLREQGRHDTADNAVDRFRLIIDGDPIAETPLEDLTRADFREWRERLRKGRKNRSVNRHVRSVVAGLNRAIREGHAGNPEAWRVDPLADDAEADATVFLEPEKRAAIIKAAGAACAALLHAIECTGGRPGELAAATVADFDRKGGTLTLRHKKGRPAKVRARAVVLADDALPFFRRMAKGKTPAAPLLTDADGEPWHRHKWSDEVQKAIAGAKDIPPGVSAYTFRHCRISELLQQFGIDPVTVAMQTGTSVKMIEQSYNKFIAVALRDKLASIEGTTL